MLSAFLEPLSHKAKTHVRRALISAFVGAPRAPRGWNQGRYGQSDGQSLGQDGTHLIGDRPVLHRVALFAPGAKRDRWTTGALT